MGSPVTIDADSYELPYPADVSPDGFLAQGVRFGWILALAKHETRAFRVAFPNAVEAKYAEECVIGTGRTARVEVDTGKILVHVARVELRPTHNPFHDAPRGPACPDTKGGAS